VRSSPADEAIAAATEGGLYIPIARVFDGQLGFICRNDPVPTQGIVIGLAAPSVQRDLDESGDEPDGDGSANQNGEGAST
jgi:hypothetical protein